MKKRELTALIGSALIYLVLLDILTRIQTVLTLRYFAAVI